MTAEYDVSGRVRKFLQSMDLATRLENFKDDEDTFFELILSQSIEIINKKVFLHLIDMVRSYQSLDFLKNDDLYIVRSLDFPIQLHCILGSDIFSPPIEIPTVNQFQEGYDWHKRIKTNDSRQYRSVDDFVRSRVIQSFGIVDYNVYLLSGEVVPWEYILLSEDGEEMQKELLQIASSEINKIRNSINFLKRYRAPIFIQEERRVSLERLKRIISLLKEG